MFNELLLRVFLQETKLNSSQKNVQNKNLIFTLHIVFVLKDIPFKRKKNNWIKDLFSENSNRKILNRKSDTINLQNFKIAKNNQKFLTFKKSWKKNKRKNEMF